jgi:hypothetical protein
MAAEVSPALIREWYTTGWKLEREQQQVFLDTVEHGILGDHQEIVTAIKVCIKDDAQTTYMIADKTPEKDNVNFTGEPEKTGKLIQALSKNADGEAVLGNFLAALRITETAIRARAKEVYREIDAPKRYRSPFFVHLFYSRWLQLIRGRIEQVSEILAGFDARRKQATEEKEEEEDRRLEAHRLAEMRKRVAAAPPTDGSPDSKRARFAAAALEVTQGDVDAAARLLLLF